MPLRVGKRLKDVAARIQQIGQAGVRELGFGLGGPGGEHAPIPLRRGSHASLPQGGLPDPRLALKEEDGRAVGDILHEGVEPGELAPPPDDAVGARG